jgi:hypothetical protein
MDLFSKSIEAAFQRAKTLLWPLNKRVWVKLFVIYLFTGGCHSSFKVPLGPLGNKQQKETTISVQTTGEQKPATLDRESLNRIVAETKPKILDAWAKIRPYMYAVIVLAVLGFATIFVFSVWLSSRFQVLLIKALQDRVIEIRQKWRETAESGRSLFLFNLVLYLILLLFAVAIVGIAGGGIFFAIKHSLKGLGVAAGLLLVLGFVFLGFVGFGSWFLVRFLPIVMVRFNRTAREGTSDLWQLMRGSFGQFFVWLMLYCVVAIGVGIGGMMAVLFLAIVIGLPLAGLGVFLFIFLKSMAARAVIVGAGVFAGGMLFILLWILFSVPTGTFFTYLRMELIERALSRRPQSPARAEG